MIIKIINMNYLKGKKTYLVGLIMIVLGVLQGDNTLILEGIGFMTIRAGIGKINK